MLTHVAGDSPWCLKVRRILYKLDVQGGVQIKLFELGPVDEVTDVGFP
jgi:hypothetical protein